MGIFDWLRAAFVKKKETALPRESPPSPVRPAAGKQAADKGSKMEQPRSASKKYSIP
jgi:hypothetical protein